MFRAGFVKIDSDSLHKLFTCKSTLVHTKWAGSSLDMAASAIEFYKRAKKVWTECLERKSSSWSWFQKSILPSPRNKFLKKSHHTDNKVFKSWKLFFCNISVDGITNPCNILVCSSFCTNMLLNRVPQILERLAIRWTFKSRKKVDFSIINHFIVNAVSWKRALSCWNRNFFRKQRLNLYRKYSSSTATYSIEFNFYDT